jgi:hypothetical protein
MPSVAASDSPGRGLLRILGLAFGVAVAVGETVGVGIMRTCNAQLIAKPNVPHRDIQFPR